ncbi:hypothetical protein WS84_32980 [Burkholderia anthina]|nr:hypothetical protein WS84_32980 [Burkholderia anthina]KVH11380.1 hypothetical protein WS85_15140 [Burkholderia anthina]KVM92828.1 hypothetical protein WT06_13540 [Burkholderia anthina]KVX34699.1 hypothetical protein WT32_17975 [Burkholderia anthina]
MLNLLEFSFGIIHLRILDNQRDIVSVSGDQHNVTVLLKFDLNCGNGHFNLIHINGRCDFYRSHLFTAISDAKASRYSLMILIIMHKPTKVFRELRLIRMLGNQNISVGKQLPYRRLINPMLIQSIEHILVRCVIN